jgi:hypothetical protein
MRCIIALGFAGLLLGCSDNTVGQVSGTVKYDNALVEDGFIDFISADGKAPTAGSPIQSGQYSAKVPVGNTQVKISMAKVIGKKKIYPTPDSPERPIKAEALPAKYNEKTELRYQVTPGTQTKDFDLAK